MQVECQSKGRDTNKVINRVASNDSHPRCGSLGPGKENWRENKVNEMDENLKSLEKIKKKKSWKQIC